MNGIVFVVLKLAVCDRLIFFVLTPRYRTLARQVPHPFLTFDSRYVVSAIGGGSCNNSNGGYPEMGREVRGGRDVG